jgi:hypothetical protein
MSNSTKPDAIQNYSTANIYEVTGTKLLASKDLTRSYFRDTVFGRERLKIFV